ncbi:glucosyltransferase, partial [Amycolatopsis vancoresmycina DSM 44592]
MAATRQHTEVAGLAVDRAPGLRTLSRLLRSPGWWAATGLAAGAGLLHLVALALAPLPVVQPLGVFSLVLTVLFGPRARTRRVVAAVGLVVAGVAGFVAFAASAAPAAAIGAGTAEGVAVTGFVLAALGWFARAGCAATAASAAVLFGLGSSVVHAAASQPPATAA